MLLALLEAHSCQGGDLKMGTVGEGTGEHSLDSLGILNLLRLEQQ